MHLFANRRPGRRHILLALLTGLITSAALAGCQPLSPVRAETAQSPRLSSAVDGVFSPAPLQAPELGEPALDAQPVWTAPALADYPFERVEPTVETSAVTVAREPSADENPVPTQDSGKLVDVGIASTYGEGDGFQGKRTACGQRFDTHVPQVAHKSLPCGTTVRVEDAASGKSVLAEVTDRGPYIKGRVVDLSWAAFSQLHPRSPDLLSVRVYVVANATA